MNEHVFGKKEVGFCGNPASGGVYLETKEKFGVGWMWFIPNVCEATSREPYGLQEDNA